MDIKEATRAELLAELARRERVPRELTTQRRLYCDECIHFATAKSECLAGKKHLRFRIPAAYSEAEEGDWGFYKVHCRPVTGPPAIEITASEVRRGVPMIKLRCLCGAEFEAFHADPQVWCQCGRLAQTGELSKVWRSKRDRAAAAEVTGL